MNETTRFLIHFSFDGHVGCSNFLAVVNKLAIKTCIKDFCVYKFSTHLGKYQRECLLSHIASLALFEMAKLSSKITILFIPVTSLPDI
jgi:hypothetical protein